VAVDRRILLQHLERLAAEFGQDLVLPRGEARARPAASAPTPTSPPAPAAAAPAPPSGPPLARPPAVAPTPAPASPTAPSPFETLRSEVLACTRCKLHEQRRHAVFGEGNPRADVMFVGEAPGAVEDQTGRPFVGPAGQLLDRIITGAMGLQRSDVYIANINKCRPPGNRVPEPDEVAACLPYLRAQIAQVQPKVLVCLGRTAVHNLLGRDEPMRTLRGQELEYDGIPVVVTWHPAYLLREPSRKAETWEDIKRVNRLLGRPEVPQRPGA
jgi:uracil-DNA glycosylase family 4